MRKFVFIILGAWLGLFGALFSLTATAGDVNAGLTTVLLDVEGMTCNMCPITVKKALKNVEGVTDVTTKYEGNGVGWAKVTFDAKKVKVGDLTFVTEDAGFPSRANAQH